MTRARARVKLTTTPPVKRLARRNRARRELFCEVCMRSGVPLASVNSQTICADRASCEQIAPPLFTREEAEQ